MSAMEKTEDSLIRWIKSRCAKKRPDVRIIEVTREDRDALPERLCRSIGSLFTI